MRWRRPNSRLAGVNAPGGDEHGNRPSSLTSTPRRLTEAVNGVIETTRRIARRFRNFSNYRLRNLLAQVATVHTGKRHA
jgi:hypothetical protein